jgi:hypothetical protein
MKDWTGNQKSIYTTLGASSHAVENREINDYYATSPKAAEMLLGLEEFNNILEPACGEGHLSKVFISKNKKVLSTDLINRGYGETKNFFDYDTWNGDIITNPPYKYAQEFIEHSLKIIPNGRKVAMFLKIQFLEGKKRKKLFEKCPPKTIYISSSRLLCAKNGKFGKGIGFISSSAVAYAWFVWHKGYSGDTIIKWFN